MNFLYLKVICGSFHTLCLSYNNVITDGMDTQSTNEPFNEKSVTSLKADLSVNNKKKGENFEEYSLKILKNTEITGRIY
jgi:hypothetical protein